WPPLWIECGSCASIRNLCVSGGDFIGPCRLGGVEAGATGPRAKYTSSVGKPSKADSGRPKFFESRDLDVWPIQSLMLKVANSEKSPLSKIRMKWQGLSPRHWSMWPWPRGKYQMSPGSNSFVSELP